VGRCIAIAFSGATKVASDLAVGKMRVARGRASRGAAGVRKGFTLIAVEVDATAAIGLNVAVNGTISRRSRTLDQPSVPKVAATCSTADAPSASNSGQCPRKHAVSRLVGGGIGRRVKPDRVALTCSPGWRA